MFGGLSQQPTWERLLLCVLTTARGGLGAGLHPGATLQLDSHACINATAAYATFEHSMSSHCDCSGHRITMSRDSIRQKFATSQFFYWAPLLFCQLPVTPLEAPGKKSFFDCSHHDTHFQCCQSEAWTLSLVSVHVSLPYPSIASLLRTAWRSVACCVRDI